MFTSGGAFLRARFCLLVRTLLGTQVGIALLGHTSGVVGRRPRALSLLLISHFETFLSVLLLAEHSTAYRLIEFTLRSLRRSLEQFKSVLFLDLRQLEEPLLAFALSCEPCVQVLSIPLRQHALAAFARQDATRSAVDRVGADGVAVFLRVPSRLVHAQDLTFEFAHLALLHGVVRRWALSLVLDADHATSAASRQSSRTLLGVPGAFAIRHRCVHQSLVRLLQGDTQMTHDPQSFLPGSSQLVGLGRLTERQLDHVPRRPPQMQPLVQHLLRFDQVLRAFSE